MNLRRLLSALASRVLMVGLVLVVGVAPARADQVSDEDRAAARILFDKGRALMKEQRYEEACAQFDASRKLVRGSGILFKLAECYEKLGRTASAWINYLEVARLMRRQKDASREAVARRRADALKPKLSMLLLDIRDPVEGLELRRNGTLQPRAKWGSAMPVDPGKHTIVVSAPGYLMRTYNIEVGETSDAITLTVAPLTLMPEPYAPPGDEPTPIQDNQLVLSGWIVGGLGCAQLVTSLSVFIAGSIMVAEADAECTDRVNCQDDDVISKGNTGRALTTTSLVLLGTGIPGLAAGIIMGVVGTQRLDEDKDNSAGLVGLSWQPASNSSGVVTLHGRW